MNRYTFTSIATLTLLIALAETANAQFPRTSRNYSGTFRGPTLQTRRRPTVSPYLGLLSGRGVGFEYYNRVKPQQEFRRANAALGQSISDLQQQANAAVAQEQIEIGATGHLTSFMSHTKYFGVGLSPTAGPTRP